LLSDASRDSEWMTGNSDITRLGKS
jgi:hypothetical protein